MIKGYYSNTTIENYFNKIIDKVYLNDKDQLCFSFTDGASFKLSDEGQCCCESRYMVVEDDLTEYCGSMFLGYDMKDVVYKDSSNGDEHEIQFLEIKTSRGSFTISSHNEHNGYYGGFNLCILD